MHEVSLIENVLALVEQQVVAEDKLADSGALGHAAPDALRFCFDAVTTGTIAEGSRLEIETIPGAGWCADCRDTVPLVERFAACPVCAGNRVTMTSGDDLRLVEMEVE